MTEEQLINRLRQFIKDCKGQARAARRLHVSQTILCLTLSGKRPLGRRIASGLGYRRVITYEEI